MHNSDNLALYLNFLKVEYSYRGVVFPGHVLTLVVFREAPHIKYYFRLFISFWVPEEEKNEVDSNGW